MPVASLQSLELYFEIACMQHFKTLRCSVHNNMTKRKAADSPIEKSEP